MTASIPRAMVAAALGLESQTDLLPPGDLPVARLAARYAAYLATPEADAGTETADAWTGAVMDHLMAFDPVRALDVLAVGAAGDGAAQLVDPLLDLAEAAPDLDLAGRAAADPAFAALLAAARD
jgi:hypothetical protein